MALSERTMYAKVRNKTRLVEQGAEDKRNKTESRQWSKRMREMTNGKTGTPEN
jgi:hypothetical protein